jgi:hypothetical protein
MGRKCPNREKVRRKLSANQGPMGPKVDVETLTVDVETLTVDGTAPGAVAAPVRKASSAAVDSVQT